MIIQTISMKSITAEGLGTLSVFEGGHDVPFDIKRIYYIYGAPQGTQRGGHAHKALRQVLWCPYGSILIKLDDGHEKSEVLLDDPATPWPLKRLAALAGYSPWHFLRRFRRETGLTPHAFYLLCRLRLARPVAGGYGSGRGRRIRRFYGPEPSAQAVQATARHDVGAVPAGKPQAGSVMNLANNQRPFSPARTSCGVLAGRIAMLPGR